MFHQNCSCPVCVPEKYLRNNIGTSVEQVQVKPNRTVYEAFENYIAWYHLDGVEDCMSKEELQEFRRKSKDVFETANFGSLEQKAFAEKMFRMGYMAAHIRYSKENGGF